jgi:TatD DNase family protein
MWFDSHCHLQICSEDRPIEELLDGTRRAGLKGMVTVGIDIASSRRVVELADGDHVWASVGIHPNSADQLSDASLADLEELVVDPHVVAVGESGLDFYRDEAPPERQRDAFAAHMSMAKDHDVALIIHTRASVGAALDFLEKQGPPDRFVFHCWSGDGSELRRAIDLGAYVSFAGNVTFKNAPDLRERAAEVPADRLLVETDAPFLAPVPNRGRPNEPAWVGLVGTAVAEARGEDPSTVARTTERNSRTFFALDR